MRLALLPALALLFAPFAAPAQTLTLEQIMADPDWIGAPVENPFWSLDGQQVFYEQKRQGSALRDLYGMRLSSGPAYRVDDAQRAELDAPNPVFDQRRERALLLRHGDLFLRDLRNGRLVQLTRGQTVADPMFSSDQNQALFRSGHDWYGVALDTGLLAPVALLRAAQDPDAEPKPDTLRELQHELIQTFADRKAEARAQREREAELRRADPARAVAPIHLGDDIKLLHSALSPDRRWLLAVTEPKDAPAGQRGKMPLYVTESGYEESEDVRTRVGRNLPVGQRLWLVDLVQAKARALAVDTLPGIEDDPLAALRAKAGKEALKGPRAVQAGPIRFSRDGARAALMLRAIDNKDRWLVSIEAGKTVLEPRHRLTDPAWINWSFNEFGWLDDQRSLWFLSEQSGYSHLYTLAPGSNKARALTSGEWEVSDPQLAPDGSHFLFLCNRAWPGDYEICRRDLNSGTVREITSLDGVEAFAHSPDGRQLLVTYSGSYLPAQLAVLPAQGGKARVLTDTRSPAFSQIDWLQPRFEAVPSRHVKQPLWSKLYRPAQLEAGRKYPIVLFVHGAGYTQNTHARYPYYFREQMFHALLVQHGYLVLDIDYRASKGYGRDWRTAIYRNIGMPELQDLIDGVNWLVEYHQGDASRVGIYGGSYGGFMSLMAMFKAPETFHAGAALRPVTDWTQYNHPYTANILNTPDIDLDSYRNGSPIFHAEGLKGDLLIAHGMMDENVFYQDSVRLAQRLIELKKENWELAGYPLERHGFVQPEAWLDQYRRIFRLFERRFKTDPSTTQGGNTP